MLFYRSLDKITKEKNIHRILNAFFTNQFDRMSYEYCILPLYVYIAGVR